MQRPNFRAQMHHPASSVAVNTNPRGAAGGDGANNFDHHDDVTFPVVSVDSSETPFKLVKESPPVTELVTETPLENGLSSLALGVIGGKHEKQKACQILGSLCHPSQ